MPKTVLDHYSYGKALADLDSTRRELETFKADRCDECGTKLSSYIGGCPFCGAPVCCQSCCKIEYYGKELAALREKVRLLLEWAGSSLDILGGTKDHPANELLAELRAAVEKGK